jgi:hypothetical protein
MSPFERYYLYEFLAAEGILHLGFQDIRLDTAADADAMWAEYTRLLARYGPCWLIVCLDRLDASPEGAERLVELASASAPRPHGTVRYTSGRVRMDKRFTFLREYSRQRMPSHLYSSREEAFAEIRRRRALAR